MYSSNRAGPTAIHCTAEKNANCGTTIASSAYATTTRQLAATLRHRPASARTANGASTTAPMPTRKTSTPPVDQPVSKRPRPSGPERLNVTAETTAMSSPAATSGVFCVLCGTASSLVKVVMTHDDPSGAVMCQHGFHP